MPVIDADKSINLVTTNFPASAASRPTQKRPVTTRPRGHVRGRAQLLPLALALAWEQQIPHQIPSRPLAHLTTIHIIIIRISITSIISTSSSSICTACPLAIGRGNSAGISRILIHILIRIRIRTISFPTTRSIRTRRLHLFLMLLLQLLRTRFLGSILLRLRLPLRGIPMKF
jgi:hypothetical protein